MRIVPGLLPILLHFSEIVFSFVGFVLQFCPEYLREKELFFICNIWGRCWHLYGCCLNVFLDFEMDLFRNFQFQSWEKVGRCVNWTSDMCYFRVKLQHIIACIPQGWWNGFRLGKSDNWFVVRQYNRRFWCFPQYVCKFRKYHVDCQKFLRLNWHLKPCRRKDFWSKCYWCVRFPFWLDFLIRIIFNHKGIPCTCEACISH